jgi:signal transduction histidine kinase
MAEIELTKIEDGVFVFDSVGKIEFCSEYCEIIVPGFTEKLDNNSYLEDVYTAILSLGFRVRASIANHTEDKDLIAEGWSVFKSVPGNIEFISDDGQVLNWSTRRYGDEEIFAILSDNTWNARRSMRDSQHSKMVSISDMSGQIGHDLNNFLTIIQGNLELLETFAEEDEKFSRWVSAATVATERGSDMAKNMLYLGRRRPARRRDVATADIVMEMVEKLESQIDSSIKIDTLIPSNLHGIRVDESHFKIVLEHLFQNAVDACEEKGSISIRADNFVMDENHTDENEIDDGQSSFVRITVSDTGHGMSIHVSERAFEPYFTTKSNKKGVGLGLSIAYGFARQSGGTLKMESKSEVGTSVELEIPVHSGNRFLPPIPLESDIGKLSGKERILVVEDDTAVRTIAVEMLSSIGYDVVQATDATNALDQLEAGCRVDLVFSDVIMPGGFDGIRMARIIRDRYPQFKILLASGYVDSERLSGIHEFAFLGKPYGQKILAQHVRQLLDE